MKVNDKVLSRLHELIDVGQQVLTTRRSLGPNIIGDDTVEPELTIQWVTSIQSLIEQVFGTDAVHLKTINKLAERYISYTDALKIQGVLKAAKDDYEHGYLFELKTLIEAEVFDDFLEQAEYLLNSGFFQPSAVIIGSILEDGLRKLCLKQGIELDDRPKLDRMNADLAKNGTYNKLTQKQITAFADLRNKAAHGKWDEFTPDGVKFFLNWVRTFMEGNFQ